MPDTEGNDGTDAAVVIEAAGGAVWRHTANGALEVLVVHRPKYDDWTLPKGKLDPGETGEEGALREVEEETGLRGTLGPEIAEVRYDDRHGRPKRVRYWAMTVDVDVDAFAVNDEVDEVRWLSLADATALLTYRRDLAVLDALRGSQSLEP
ncbi:MAG: NUDIX hydrolase [Microthrixaceae bacterium]